MTPVWVGELDVVARVVETVEVLRVALGAATGNVVGPERLDVVRQHAQRPGFAAYGAFEAAGAEPGESGRPSRLVGFGYGYVEQPGSWWRGYVEPALARSGQAHLLDLAFTVAELHVRPDRQGQGLGARLLGALLERRPQSWVLLSTQLAANPSRGFYDHLGFRQLAAVDFPGQPAYAVLGRALPLGAASSGEPGWRRAGE